MQFTTIENAGQQVTGSQPDMAVTNALTDAAAGDVDALYDLGVMYSTASHGCDCDLIEAHKWFNLAASKGHEKAGWCRADIADEMSAREISEAQRQAREWLAEGRRAA